MKRSGYSIKKLTAKLLCAVLTVGMLSGAAPINVYAEENVKTEKMSEGGGVQSAGTGAGGTRRAESVLEQPGLPKEPSENDLPSGEDAAGNQGETQENEEKGKTDNGEDKTENDEVEDSEEEDGGAENNEAEDDGSVTDGDAILSEEEIMPTKEDGQAVPLEDHIHDGVVYTAWPETDRLPDAAGNYYLTENVTLTDTWEVPAGTTNLCLNGKTIALAENSGKDSCVISIGKNIPIYLYDCADGGNITGGTDSGIRNEGSFTMYGGEISGNSSTTRGAGVYNGTNGIFEMYNGSISNNSAWNEDGRHLQGGGIYNAGKFHFSGGEIFGNLAHIGGGVYNSGTFSVSGGQIQGNTGFMGIGVYNLGAFEMRGGKITNNKGKDTEDIRSNANGGGVCNYGTFDLFSGEISGNVVVSGGGVENEGTFTMHDGKIEGNTATLGNGGGVENGGAFIMNGGKIIGNHSGRHGGGVFNWNTFKVYGGEIGGNTAGENGGGVAHGVRNGIMSKTTLGGSITITGNKDVHDNDENLGLLYEYPHAPGLSTIITIDSANPLTQAANIGVTINCYDPLTEGSTINISGSNAADYSSRFHSDNPDYAIQNGADNTVLLVIPIPHTHKWSSDWSNDETHHWHECTAAGCSVTEKADKDGLGVHTEDGGTITKQPTETEEGETVYRCSICGYEMRKEAIPATGGGETPEPDEGDKPGPGGGDKPDTGEDDKPIREEDNKPDGSGDLSEENVIVQTGDPVIGNTETGTQDGVSDKDNITIPASESNVPDESAAPAEPSQDAEPKTGNLSPVELYATLAMISGLTYLLLYFTDRSGGMTEETKKELVSKLIRWAKRGKTMRRLTALAVIFALLVYYHSIGKQSAIEWKEA